MKKALELACKVIGSVFAGLAGTAYLVLAHYWGGDAPTCWAVGVLMTLVFWAAYVWTPTL
jgi:hypothetical protein